MRGEPRVEKNCVLTPNATRLVVGTLITRPREELFHSKHYTKSNYTTIDNFTLLVYFLFFFFCIEKPRLIRNFWFSSSAKHVIFVRADTSNVAVIIVAPKIVKDYSTYEWVLCAYLFAENGNIFAEGI